MIDETLPLSLGSPGAPAQGGVAVSLENHAEPAKGSEFSFEHAATLVLGRLQQSLLDLLAALPSPPRKAVEVQRSLGVDYFLSWQVFRIANSANPLAAGVHVPARVSMTKLLKAASRKSVPEEIIDRVNAAFDEYERMVLRDAGNRQAMEAMLTAFVPEEQEKYELAAKEANFNSISQIKGIANESATCSLVLFPSGEPGMVDRAIMQGEFGMRRIRPDVPLFLSISGHGPADTASLTLDGLPVADIVGLSMRTGVLLQQFCSSPLPQFQSHVVPPFVYYRIMGNEVGLRSSVDFVYGSRKTAVMRQVYRPGDAHKHAGVIQMVTMPTKRLTTDVFIHRDVYPGVMPELMIYDTTRQGMVGTFGDPGREHDRLRLHESLRPLPPGLETARLSHVPRYTEMLELLFTKCALNPKDFRAYRLDVMYPLYGAQYMIGFKKPHEPQQS